MSMPTLSEMLGMGAQAPMREAQNPQLMALIAAAMAKRKKPSLEERQPVAPMIGVRG